MQIPANLLIYLGIPFILNHTEEGEVIDADGIDYDLLQIFCGYYGTFCKFYSWRADIPFNILASSFVVTEAKLKYALNAHAINHKTFATGRLKYATGAIGFVKPFSPETWIVTFFTVLAVSMLHFLMFKGRNSLFSAFYYILNDCLGQYHDWKPKSAAQKTLVFSWNIGLTVLIFGYGSLLLSLLTIPARENSVKNFDDLYNAIREGKYTARSIQRHNEIDCFVTSSDMRMRFIGKHIQTQKKVERFKGIMKILKKGNVAVIGTRTYLQQNLPGKDYFISEDSYALEVVSLMEVTKHMFEKEFCCREVLNKFISRMWASGIMKKCDEWRDFLAVSYYQNDFSSEESIKILGLDDLVGIFYVLITGNVIGIIILFFEIYAGRQSCRVKQQPKKVSSNI